MERSPRRSSRSRSGKRSKSAEQAKGDSMKRDLVLRVVVVAPPRGVRFAMQRGRAELLAPARETESEISFDLTVRVGDNRPDGLPNFLGPLAQGPPAGRFLYVTSGTLAAQPD